MGCNLLNKTEETKEALWFFFFFAQEDSVNYSLNWETVLHCTEIFSFLFFHLTHAFSSLSHTHTHTHTHAIYNLKPWKGQ